MHLKALLLTIAVVLLIPQAASAQPYDPYGRRYYDDGYRRPPPPPPPPGYYEERRYYREAPPPPPPQAYRRGGVFCAREGGYCRFEGPAIVRYGAGGRFATRRAFNGIPCNNATFGDPFVGADKACYID